MMRRLLVLAAWLLAAGTALATESGAPQPATRIVSLAPNLTELAFAAGAGDRVVATVEYSDYPKEALAIPRIGDAFRVDMERLLALKPDLVLAWDSGTPVQVIERMRALGLRVESVSTPTLVSVSAALRRLGELAGTQREAEREAARVDKQVAQLRAQYRDRKRISVFIQINDRPLFTVNGKHIISEVVAICGGTNVFAQLNDLAPTIGIEAILAANPQAIISTDDTVPDAAAAWRRWHTLTAVQAGNVFTLSSDELTRATPRLLQGARALCRTLDTARRNLQQESA